MEITISAKHMELTDALKNYTTERMGRVKKYIDHTLAADIHLGVEKYRHKIHATIKGRGYFINSEAEDPSSMYKAIDLCVDKLETQLRRGKNSFHEKKVGKEAIRESHLDAEPSMASDFSETIES